MIRKIFMLMVLLSVSGLAHGAWGDIALTQIEGWGGDNDAQIAQQEPGGPYEVDAYQNAGPIFAGNDLIIGQKGSYIKAKLVQNAWGWSNDAVICQIGDDLKTKVEQNGMYNDAHIQQYGTDSKIKIKQTAGGWFGGNNATILQQTDHSKIKIKQESTGKGNDADVIQTGSYSEIRVRQEATSSNDLRIRQIGSGHGNKIKLKQVATGIKKGWCGPSTGYNDADIEQHGSRNKLVGARPEQFDCIECPGITGTKAVVDWCEPATQTGLYNELDLYQEGCHNVVGLYQNAPNGYNKADITQTGGGNTLAVYQDNPIGNNDISANQSGGQSAYIYQSSTYGGGTVTVHQGPI